MPKKVQLERFFLCFVAHSTNFKQIKAALRAVDRQQYMVLREAARNILQGTIELEPSTLDTLKKNKIFIRKLDVGQATEQELAIHSDVVCEIVRLALQYHAIDEYACGADKGRVEQSDEENKS